MSEIIQENNRKSPLVSIIIPVYNAEKYILGTVEGVLSQTFQDFECILVDNGSTDESVNLIKSVEDSRVRLLSCKEKGAACARNAGVREAKGRYIAYLDSDDIWAPEKLEKTIDFSKKEDAAFVFTAYEFADIEGNGTGKIVHVPDQITYKEALSRTVIFTSTVVFDLTKLSKEEIMMPEVKSEDTALWWKVLKTGIVARGLDENLVKYRTGGKSLSSNKFIAIKRIWALYGMQGDLNFFQKAFYFCGWAWRAVVRRI